MSPAHDVFTRICRSVEDRYADSALLCGRAACRSLSLCAGVETTLDDLKAHAVRGESERPDRIAAWSHIAHHLGEEAENRGEGDWTLITAWLLAPRLRGASWAIARSTGAERADVASALLQGVLGAASAAEHVDATQIEQHLVDAAFAAGWQTGRRSPKETLVREVGEQDSARNETLLQSLTDSLGELVHVDAMSGVLAQRAQGERLGSLAYRMGLLAHVRNVRRHSRSRQGSQCAGVHRALGEPSEQPRLFEMWGSGDEASS
ncbi:hypothetical protein OG275_17180 [Streptomyces niveus]|uniref:hypothetical protein n=1 Tax=Streptomyces niveus TaxID=193462 RepID=UPI002E309B4B|nr:hypothetical protein [Streptomyces niveus]